MGRQLCFFARYRRACVGFLASREEMLLIHSAVGPVLLLRSSLTIASLVISIPQALPALMAHPPGPPPPLTTRCPTLNFIMFSQISGLLHRATAC